MPAKVVIKNLESGRSFEVDIVLDESQVSRQHASIKMSGTTFTLADLGRANGTFINGQRVNEHVMRDGDSFSISKYTFDFKDTAGTSVKYASRDIEGTMVM